MNERDGCASCASTTTALFSVRVSEQGMVDEGLYCPEDVHQAIDNYLDDAGMEAVMTIRPHQAAEEEDV